MKTRSEATKAERPLDRLGSAQPGHDALWLWFGLSYASWLTMPRVMMHAMPDDWQARMAQLCQEWDEAWDSSEMPNTRVQAERNGRLTKWPGWLLDYRHPNQREIEKLRPRGATSAKESCK